MAEDLFEALFAVVDLLARDEIEHALVGGFALAVHGVPRATTDIDLLVDPQDVDRATAAVKRAGFTSEALPTEFADGMRLQRVTRVRDGESLTIDFILADPPLQPAWASRRRYEAEDGSHLWVIGRDALIAMKVLAGRPQDLADVERLQEIDR